MAIHLMTAYLSEWIADLSEETCIRRYEFAEMRIIRNFLLSLL